MPDKYLLDTNAAIALLNGDQNLISKITGEFDLYLPVPAAGELYFGAAKSRRLVENTDRITAFIAANVLIACDHSAALSYGRLKMELESVGRRIPDNDMWIAAIARHYRMALITRDSHFDNVSGLVILSW